VTLIVAIIIVVVTFVRARYPNEADPRKPIPYDPKDSMGNAQWDLTKSWASNLTVVGAWWGTILGAVKNAGEAPFLRSAIQAQKVAGLYGDAGI
jgi:hypothetical protein